MTEYFKQHLRAFLCYSSIDKPVIHELYNHMIANNLDTWFDDAKLLPGQDRGLETSRAIKNSNVLIICLSQNSVSNKGNLSKEIRSALDISSEQPTGKNLVILGKLDNIKVPNMLSAYKSFDLFVQNGHKNFLDELIKLSTQFDNQI
jgi:TIR domain-containing protein